MKRVALILAVIIFLAACATPQAVEIIESTQENDRLYRSFEEIVATYTVETLEEIRPHHYGEFDNITFGAVSREFYETTREGLEYWATNIVRARMMDDATIVFARTDQANPERITLGYNIVSINIIEVVSGDLTAGQTIRIIEPYFVYNGVLDIWADYMPSVPHQEYVFFLGSQIGENRMEEFIGAYWGIHNERSRFPVPGGRTRASIMQHLGEDGRFSADTQNFESALFGLGRFANVETYMSIWEEVMNEYVLPTLTGIDLRPGGAVLEVGETLAITAVVLPATDSVATWVSNNPGVATVSPTGVVTAVGVGVTTITATTVDGPEATSDVLVTS